MQKRPFFVVVSIAGVAGAFLAGAYAGQLGQPPAVLAPPIETIAPQVEAVALDTTPLREVPDGAAQVQLSFAPVVKAVTPSVVNVYATTVTASQPGLGDDPFFQRFFGGGDLFGSRPRQSQSLGSGVIVDSAGVILTNSHVVHGATDVRVATNDGHEYAVDVVLDDGKTDLAVLKVRDTGGRSFPALAFADSDALQVGDLVLAIGNPFGVGQTVTSGIVSALARTGVESNNYEFFIQTDAAINPGNSGGALVDLSGHLVGINTAIFSRTGGSVGIGFAIPANMAKTVAEAGIAGGTIVRPWFGARTQEVTADIADSLGLGAPHGALITEVAEGGPAARAGFRAGDVILSVDGGSIDRPSAFDFRLATHKVGSEAKIEFWRDGKAQDVTVTLEGPGTSADDLAEVVGDTRFAGATVETITPAIAQDFSLDFDAKGVVVAAISPGSPADEMGLQVGDVVVSLNGEAVDDATQFASIAEARPNAWRIVLRRGDRTFRSVVSG